MNITELLTDLASNTNAIIRSIASRFNLTTSQAFNLLLIPFGGIPISNLAYKLGLDNSTLTRNIQKLEKLCLVNRESDKYDKRVQRVVLTKDGMSLVKSLSEDLDDHGSNILDNIDLEFAESLGITTYNTPDSVTNSTADHTIALLLSLIRKIPDAITYVKNNKWGMWNPEIFIGEELQGKTLGIIGFGKIGQAVALRAKGFGLRVIYYNHSKKEVDPAIEKFVKSLKFHEVLESSDYLSLHLPLTTKTKEMINKKIFQKMKKLPILINMARGEIVNTDDLLIALKNGDLRGAALDVTNPEPISGYHELCSLKNCIIVPHIGTATSECRIGMARIAAENICNHYELG